MTKNLTGKIAVMGGGSWATALAKLLLLAQDDDILWYMRRDDRIADFKRLSHNPVYLSDIRFDTDRIYFSSDINEISSMADTLLLAIPSPYLKSHLAKLTADISGKQLVSAVKGMVADDNIVVSEYMQQFYGIDSRRIAVVSGPCHAEEVALERLSYLTIGSKSAELASAVADRFNCKSMRTILSDDVTGIEYAAVLKNVYAIASGIVHGMKGGDNFLAVLLSNAIREMDAFVSVASPCEQRRNICDSVYLGDLLVTSYSRFSRNHNFGSMIGKGYSVKAAMMEMEMVAARYYGTKWIYELNCKLQVPMPILDGVYEILYNYRPATKMIMEIAATFH